MFEGIALSTLDCYEALGRIPGLGRLAGGGAKGDLLPPLIADLLQTPVEVKSDPELGTRGAGVLAAIAAGAFGSVKVALAVRDCPGTTVDPGNGSARLRARLPLYRRIAHALSDVWRMQHAEEFQ